MFHRPRSRGFQQRQVSYESEASSRGRCAVGAADAVSVRVSRIGKQTTLLLGSACLLVISIASLIIVLGLLTLPPADENAHPLTCRSCCTTDGNVGARS
jgi:hypothetical protein